jgi:hypothetical protein
MLDINLLRADKGGDPDLVRESIRKRFAKVELVDEVIDLDQAWRTSKNLLPRLLSQPFHISDWSLTPRDSRLCRAVRAGKDKAGAQCHEQEDREAQSREFRFVSACDRATGLGFVMSCLCAEQARRGSQEADGEHGVRDVIPTPDLRIGTGSPDRPDPRRALIGGACR